MFSAVCLSLLVLRVNEVQAQEPLSADSFFEVLSQLHFPIENVSFQWESTIQYIGGENVEPKVLAEVNKSLSGSYLYRNDGSMRVEVYTQPAQGPMRRRSVSVEGSVRRELAGVPDRGVKHAEIGQASSVAELNYPAWPHRILYLAYFNTLPSNIRSTFRHEGWEVVDGHRCLKASLNPNPGVPPDNLLLEKLWIDLERGGHVLRLEHHHQGHLRLRLSDVELRELPMPSGDLVWLPIHGRVESFGWQVTSGKKPSLKWFRAPQVREEIHFMAASAKLNQGVTAEAIKVQFEQGMPVHGTHQPSQTDDLQLPVPVHEAQNLLDQSLLAADAQLGEFRAISRARSRWSWGTILPATFAVMGLVVLAWLAYLQKRARE